jgi:hypothetical protein
LPTFIIGGAPRSGTNFLCHALARHPEIYLARPFMPEPKVFMGPPRDGAAYRARYAELFAEAGDRGVLGEKTSYYLENEGCCALIRRHVPGVRMLFVLREPVARAYSNWLWSGTNGLETLPFEEAVRREGRRPSPLPPDRDYARPFDYLARGAYDVFARRYLDAFGPARVGFWLYERLVASPDEVLGEMQAFIGVAPHALATGDLGLVNAARETGPPIDPGTERVLRARMAPAVRRLAALTGIDVSPWGYDAAG